MAGILLPPLSIGCLPSSDPQIEAILYKINLLLFFLCMLILIPYVRAMFFSQDSLLLIPHVLKEISFLMSTGQRESRIEGLMQDLIQIIRSVSGDSERLKTVFELIKNDRKVVEYVVENARVIQEVASIGYTCENYRSKKTVIDFLSDIAFTDHIVDKELLKENIRNIAKIGASSPNFNHDVLIVETEDIMKRIFDICFEKELDEFDYSVFVFSLEKLCEKAFENGFQEGVKANIEILYSMVISFRKSDLHANPTMRAIREITNIGIRCVEKKWEDLLFHVLVILLNLGEILSEEKHKLVSLSSSLLIAAYCNKILPEVLGDVRDLLKRNIYNSEEIKKFVYSDKEEFSAIHWSILTQYLEDRPF
jgi:hypothetical protein